MPKGAKASGLVRRTVTVRTKHGTVKQQRMVRANGGKTNRVSAVAGAFGGAAHGNVLGIMAGRALGGGKAGARLAGGIAGLVAGGALGYAAGKRSRVAGALLGISGAANVAARLSRSAPAAPKRSAPTTHHAPKFVGELPSGVSAWSRVSRGAVSDSSWRRVTSSTRSHAPHDPTRWSSMFSIRHH